jgi:5-methylcytosine-specific restriction endonuclease McrA
VKRCSRCGQTKPLNEFYARQSKCKECCCFESRARYAENKPRAQDWARGYYAANRERISTRSAEYRDRPEVRERQRTYNTQYRRRAGYRQRKHELATAARLVHPWRAAMRMAEFKARQWGAVIIPFTEEQLAAKFALWNNCCWICGEPVTTMDHVKPFAAGGAHALANIRPICRPCNRRKNAKWPVPSRAFLLGFTDRESPWLAGHRDLLKR